jgi:hypothetical protein
MKAKWFGKAQKYLHCWRQKTRDVKYELQLFQENAHLHELNAGLERIIKAEEQQEVLLHGQKLCQLQNDTKKRTPHQTKK